MYNTRWNLLIVDDEPDVLTLSKLVMKNFTVFGLPVNLITSKSKEDAVSLLETRYVVQGELDSLALGIIDVVMESPVSGLQLCNYIRNDLRNRTMQLFIRTGQAGLAPERTVIDAHDLNGYFTKVEATEDKLYTMVKSGIRQFLFSTMALKVIKNQNDMVQADSREGILPLIGRAWLPPSGIMTLTDSDDPCGQYTFIGGEETGYGLPAEKAAELREILDAQDGARLSAAGDKYVRGEKHYMMIKIAETEDTAELVHLMCGHFVPPPSIVSLMHQNLVSAARLWKKAN